MRDSPSGGNIAAEVGAGWLNLSPSVHDVMVYWYPISEGPILGGKNPGSSSLSNSSSLETWSPVTQVGVSPSVRQCLGVSGYISLSAKEF